MAKEQMSLKEASQTLGNLRNTFKALERLGDALDSVNGLERAEQEAQTALEAIRDQLEFENGALEGIQHRVKDERAKAEKSIADWNRQAAEAKGAATDAIRKAKDHQVNMILTMEEETAARAKGMQEQLIVLQAQLEDINKQLSQAEKKRAALLTSLAG
jgi:DNA repair exonuclease SbcCD ATPase subunit